MTLDELGIADIDCAFDPDDLLEGPAVAVIDDPADQDAGEDDELPIINDELLKPL
ncbi:hypothetical protein [Aureimonas sp. Leaf454]|uniref:hypothetical protein n=1 Tax=Aureimonas sp. Leaf454 TaxID=1736381 RepID=UPI0019107601|nr:hypothetical protein [Aureimonas sp. Leaf454]